MRTNMVRDRRRRPSRLGTKSQPVGCRGRRGDQL